MRKLMVLWLATLTILAACSADGEVDLETATGNGENGDVTAITLITPEPVDGYPAPDNPYPLSPVEALLPTGYPELTIDAPPSDLTPGTAGEALETRPPNARPIATPFPVSERVLAALLREMAALDGVATDEVTVAAAEPVVWPNSGLGCPAEGLAYTDVRVEGMLVVLDAGGQSYEFHTDGAQRYVLCREGRPVSSGRIDR